ncbi:MAG: UDP-N-acetylmuramoyl-tripeptide--D-alanyl-D-alanine ligase [Candidatus Dasytiphilus stammeri]
MIPITLFQIANIIDGKIMGWTLRKSDHIYTILTDTRQSATSALFFALKGKNFDGHNFITENIQNNGVKAVVVSRLLLSIKLPQIVVSDTILALGKLASWIRQQLNSTKIVALTGSCGKTTVKEMLHVILSQCGPTLSTLSNMNNKIGVSLTLLKLNPKYAFGVIELGANHPDEIAYTVKLTKPEVVLVNNISLSHLEYFGSLSGVARAKGEIFTGLKNNGIAIINNENNNFFTLWKKMLHNKVVWRFSMKKKTNSNFFASNITLNTFSTSFTIHTPLGVVDVHLSLLGMHNIANAIAATALATAVEVPLAKIRQGLSMVQAFPGRMYPVFLDKDKNKLLLDDSYNANVGSMNAAALTLAKMPGYLVMVVGDMAELGVHSVKYHQIVGATVHNIAEINKVISIGTLSKNISRFHSSGEHFDNPIKLIQRLKMLLHTYNKITILIKGSRNAGLDYIIETLK